MASTEEAHNSSGNQHAHAEQEIMTKNNDAVNGNTNGIAEVIHSVTPDGEGAREGDSVKDTPGRKSADSTIGSLFLKQQRSQSTPSVLAVTDPTIIDPSVVSTASADNSPSIQQRTVNANPSSSSSSSGFGAISEVFSKISLFASSSLNSPTKNNSSFPSPSSSTLQPTVNSNAAPNNNNTFWKSKGKVPGTIKAVRTLPPRFESTHGTNSSSPSISTYLPKGNVKKNSIDPNSSESPSIDSTTIASTFSSSSSSSSFNNNSTPNGNSTLDQSPIIFTSSSVNNTTLSNRNSLIRSLIDPSPHEVPKMTENPDGSHSPNERLNRLNKFCRVLDAPIVDMEQLKKLCWKGSPPEVRPLAWKILLGYVPTNADRREATLDRKRKEYHDCIPQYFAQEAGRTEYEDKIYRQIHIDIPRTNPTVPLFQQPKVQDLLERILYIWAIRHPASGYVQGINDLATPFFTVFLSECVDSVDTCDVESIDPALLANVEADSYWCMSKLLDGIQDHYTFAQPGLQRMIFKLKELVSRIDAPLARHLEDEDCQYLQFAFRWMNCLLMREMPLPLVIRMWDTYLAEGPAEGFGVFHVYVCAAFLVMWSDELRQRDFQEIMLFLQHLPTHSWKSQDIEVLVSQAFLLMSWYQGAPSHLKPSPLASNSSM